MKKFLKTFIIILLVLCVIGGTVYFFFKNMKEKDNTTESIVGMLKSESKIAFNESLNKMSTFVNSDGTDNRLDILIETSNKLDDIVYTLTTYLVEDDTINNEEIAKSLKSVNASKTTLNAMMKEYNIKKDSSFFNRHLGANDFYEEMSSYLTKYSTFANLLNNYINVDKTADIKFDLFNVYTNVVSNTFKTLATKDNLVVVQNDDNIEEVNTRIVIDNSYVVTSGNQFSINNNNFIKYYNKCEKQEFAKNLTTNINSVTEISENSTNEQIATYYYKLVFGM